MERLYVETKVIGAEDGTISGRAWQFNTPDRVGDIIEPDAFKGVALPLPMLAFHDPNDPVGAWNEISVEADGIHVKGAFVDEVARAREVRALVKAGAVRGLSIGFVTKKAAPRKGGGRTISALDLLEISLVTVPCHPGAGVSSAKSAVEALRVVEAINRAAALLARK